MRRVCRKCASAYQAHSFRFDLGLCIECSPWWLTPVFSVLKIYDSYCWWLAKLVAKFWTPKVQRIFLFCFLLVIGLRIFFGLSSILESIGETFWIVFSYGIPAFLIYNLLAVKRIGIPLIGFEASDQSFGLDFGPRRDPTEKSIARRLRLVNFLMPLFTILISIWALQIDIWGGLIIIHLIVLVWFGLLIDFVRSKK